MRMIRTICAAALAVVSLVQPLSAQQLHKLKIGLPSTSVAGGSLRIPHELGLFRKHGLDPEFTITGSGATSLAALLSGSFDASLIGIPELITANARGQSILMVTSTYSGYGATLILAKSVADKLNVAPTAPPADRLKALDGVLLASVSPVSDITTAFSGAAKSVGAVPRFTYMEQTAMPAALEAGVVQGYVASAPNWGPPVVAGTAVIWISGPKGDLPSEFITSSYALLGMTRKAIDANPEIPKRLVAVMADFGKALDERQNEIKTILANFYPKLSKQEIDVLFASESNALKVKPMSADEMAHNIAFVKRTGTPLPGIDSINPKDLLLP